VPQFRLERDSAWAAASKSDKAEREDYVTTLEHAIALAAKAHEGQMDKAGAPYVLHPLRVMLRMTTTEERIAAVLHDVVEDCGWTLDRLAEEGFSKTVIAALDAVTRRPNESYETFVLRAAQHPIGRRVKLADLYDNADLSRIAQPTERDHERIAKYRRAIALIEQLDHTKDNQLG
jgi:(p)ppGpp synthase/HD superfamily hydrolase